MFSVLIYIVIEIDYFRTLSFWRSIAAECISTFLYMLMTSCMSMTVSTSPDMSPATAQVYCSLVAGLAITSITTIFLPVSGAHANPTITLASASIQRMSVVRAVAYITAQCGGGVAGASAMLVLYGASDYNIHNSSTVTVCVLECILSCMIVTVYLTVTDPCQEHACHHPSISIGIGYMACLAAYRGPLNPACALAQAFLLNRWQNIWLLWAAPLLGGVCGAFCYQYVFSGSKDVRVVLENIYGSENSEHYEDEDIGNDAYKNTNPG